MQIQYAWLFWNWTLLSYHIITNQLRKQASYLYPALTCSLAGLSFSLQSRQGLRFPCGGPGMQSQAGSLTSPMTKCALNAPEPPWHGNKARHTEPGSGPAAGSRRPGAVPPLAATQRQEPPGHADTNQAVCNASSTSDWGRCHCKSLWFPPFPRHLTHTNERDEAHLFPASKSLQPHSPSHLSIIHRPFLPGARLELDWLPGISAKTPNMNKEEGFSLSYLIVFGCRQILVHINSGIPKVYAEIQT